MHLITPPLPFGPLPLRSDCSQPRLYFNARVFIVHPAPPPPPSTSPCPVSHPVRPIIRRRLSGFVYYRGATSEKPALSTLRNPRDFHFIRKQLPLNIFIRRLIILWDDARSAIAYIYGAAAFCRYNVRLLSFPDSSDDSPNVESGTQESYVKFIFTCICWKKF